MRLNQPLRGYELLEKAANNNGKLSFTLYIDDNIIKNKLHNESMLTLMSLLGETDYPIEVTNKNESTVQLTIENDAVKYLFEQYLLISNEGENEHEQDQ